MKTSEYIEIEEQYGAHNYHPLDVVITRGEGVWVYDVEGNKYLDCLSAYSAINQGHVHPRILKVLIDQAKKVTLTSRAFRNDQLPFFYKELSELTGYEMSLPMNSGAEAVETALKLARKWAYRLKKFRDTKRRSSRPPAIFMDAPSRSYRFPPNHFIRTILDHSLPDLLQYPMAI